MVYRSSQLLPFFPPSHPLEQWLPPDMGVRSSTVVSDMSHESCFYSEGSPHKLPVVLSYWTNKLWATRKSISHIDKHGHTHGCRHTQWNADGDRLALKRSRHMKRFMLKKKKRQTIHKNYCKHFDFFHHIIKWKLDQKRSKLWKDKEWMNRITPKWCRFWTSTQLPSSSSDEQINQHTSALSNQHHT